jgi:hypothetical protein
VSVTIIEGTAYITPGYIGEKDYDPALVLRVPGTPPPAPIPVVSDDPAHQNASTAGAVFHLPGKHDQKRHGHPVAYDTAVSGDDVHKQMKTYADATPKEKKAVSGYQNGVDKYGSSVYEVYNRWLRGDKGDLDAIGAEAPKHVRPGIEGLDKAIASSHLKSDVVVHKGIVNGRESFGDKWSEHDDMTGVTWTNHGYSSTSSDKQVARNFTDKRWDPYGAGSAGETPTVLNVYVRQGDHAFSVTDPAAPPNSLVNMQKEVLLPRGTSFSVVADRGLTEGVRYLDVEVQ